MNYQPTFKAVATITIAVGITACDRTVGTTCSDFDEKHVCHMTVTTDKDVYSVGDEIAYQFDIWAPQPERIWLDSDIYCGLSFRRNYRESPALGSTRHCPVPESVTLGSSTVLLDYPKSLLNPISVDKDNQYSFELSASVEQNEDGVVLIRFEDDVYFGIDVSEPISFWLVPVDVGYDPSFDGSFFGNLAYTLEESQSGPVVRVAIGERYQ